jgi:hypothetical protein
MVRDPARQIECPQCYRELPCVQDSFEIDGENDCADEHPNQVSNLLSGDILVGGIGRYPGGGDVASK